MDRCIFCKIAKGVIPSYKVAENAEFLAFLDIRPLNPGHTLIIPKTHYRWIWDMDNDMAGRIFMFANDIANSQRKTFDTEWIASQILGMGVEHAHLHLIPRKRDDKHEGENINPSLTEDMEPARMQEIADKIGKNLSSAFK